VAHTAILDGLNLNASPYSVRRIPIFRQAKKRLDTQPFLQQHGGEVVEGADFYDLVTHTIPVFVDGDTVNDLYDKVQTLQRKVNKTNVIFEYAFEGASSSSFADVLSMTSNDPFEEDDWDILVDSLKVVVVIEMLCKPFWRGLKETSSVTSYTKTPTKLTFGEIKGDVQTPCVIHFAGSSDKSYGDNLIVGARNGANTIDEGSFNPIKDFQGNSSNASQVFNGEFKRTVSVDNSSWFTIFAENTNINAVAMTPSTLNTLVGYAALDNGTILKTTDGWASVTTFSTAETGTQQDLNGIVAVTSSLIYVCGNVGTILKSSDTGGTWQTLGTTTMNDLEGLTFPTSVTGWVCGSRVVVRTTNGSTFTAQRNEAFGRVFWDIDAASTNVVGTVVNDFGATITWTSDAGATWVQAFIQNFSASDPLLLGDPRGIKMFNEDSAIVCMTSGVGSEVGMIGRTTELSAGTTHAWEKTYTGSIGLFDIGMATSEVGWAVGENGLIVHSTNANSTTESWSAQDSPTAASLRSIHPISTSEAVAAGDGFTMIETTDGGDTWANAFEGSWTLSNDMNGDYRVYARVRTDSTNSTGVNFRANVGWSGGDVIAGTSTPLKSNSTNLQWVDLGLITLPPIPLSSGVSASPFIELQTIGPSASTILVDADVAAIVPADGDILSVDGEATISKNITADHANEAVNKGTEIIDWVGSPGIRLNPGTNNNAVTLETEIFATGTEGIDPVDIFFTYFPRFLSPVVSSGDS